ncbi:MULTISPECIES: glutaredoxin family protein [Myxococcus]|uniref:Glutaredoxin n=2 Tax=Myxococcus TaxID=32 RepID=A0A511HGX1_9BACT|nr:MULTISPECIES: glutaredoxin family protein [Myxococcus]NOJ82226.1 glutaredoxin family protein [Myxococcus xanthus]NOJ89753.1 glutaredoxin family protein [Myxococcus xanthus]QDE90099.1 glutaredoxin [Myxococcus xanthus]WNZ65219.1 glutaredoxin family protein [Myxococcus sp. MxC21-1]SDF14575.1 Glutaredoxin [Myxococcus virescens]
MRVDIYSKPNCSLCDKAAAVVESVRARIPFELRIISILEDAEAFTAWRYDIPVVVIEGVPAFKHRVDAAEFEARLHEVKGGTTIAKSAAQNG